MRLPFQALSEKERDSLELGGASQAAQLRELKAKVTQLENSSRNQRSNNNDAEVRREPNDGLFPYWLPVVHLEGQHLQMSNTKQATQAAVKTYFINI